MQHTPAMAQPIMRHPTADAGCATATDRTNVSNTAVDAVAAWGSTIPAKSTTNPTTPMVATAAALLVDTTVPRAIRTLPPTHNPRYDTRRVRGAPVNSTSRRRANDPNAAKRPTW